MYLRCLLFSWECRTFHERHVGAAVVEVWAMDVCQAVISQLGSVAQTLQDWVHETLQIKKKYNYFTLTGGVAH